MDGDARGVPGASARAQVRGGGAGGVARGGDAGSDPRSSTGEGGYGEESRIVAAAKTAAALATRLDRVAGAAEARAIRALLRPATMTLEGAAAQPWRWHRKPERMPNEPPWSPHVDAWARSVDAAAARLAGAKSRDASGARMIAALATLAAAEAAGVYLRTTPSRAWRERFAWDCRRIATAVRDARFIHRRCLLGVPGSIPRGIGFNLSADRAGWRSPRRS